MIKKTMISNELFKSKKVPNFIKEHPIFNNDPIKVKKVFGSIGIPNFQENCNIDKPLIEIKKEGTFVHNLLRIISVNIVAAKTELANKADSIQYLGTKEERVANRDKLNEYFALTSILASLSAEIDPYVNRSVIDQVVKIRDGKIDLKLFKDINDSTGKRIYREGESIFKIYIKIRDKIIAQELQMIALDQTEEFKTFSKENIPHREFKIVFSSDGEEGAWDLLTMSMRGIKSCQRWEGEYPKCLIGSILSKFVGFIYLTSGADWEGIGTKMMRRSVVRYGIDTNENTPCILIDKMYPEVDKDVLKAFMAALKSKTKLPVYYSPEVGAKLKHFYIPAEDVRGKLANREWSYQDTPVRFKQEFDEQFLVNRKGDIEKEIGGFRANVGLEISRKLDDINSNNIYAVPEIKSMVQAISLNSSFTVFANGIVGVIFNLIKAPPSKGFITSRAFYRKYLMDIILKKKSLMKTCEPYMHNVYAATTSKVIDKDAFSQFLFSIIFDYARSELKRLVK